VIYSDCTRAVTLALGLCLTGCTSVLGSFDSDGNTVFKRAFVTSELFQGNFGSVDYFSICKQAATQAGLGDDWRPWVSAGDKFLCEGGPWQLADGSSKVGSCDDLFMNKVLHPINVTEFGKTVATSEVFAVWTGVAAKGGLAHPSNCNAWQSNDAASDGLVGDLNADGPAWTAKLPLSCDKKARLYCFEQ
jgi:hypothetical protein